MMSGGWKGIMHHMVGIFTLFTLKVERNVYESMYNLLFYFVPLIAGLYQRIHTDYWSPSQVGDNHASLTISLPENNR